MSWSKINQLRRIFRTSIIKTIFFNFKMLPFKQAIRLPVLLTCNTYFYSLRGKLELLDAPRFGMIRMGYFGEDTIHPRTNKSIIQIDGIMRLANNVHFGNGMTIRILPDAILEIQNNVKISNRTKIICYDRIKIGHDSRIAWECQIIDTSFHFIKNVNDGTISTLCSPITIGAHNWIGNRVTIMKGVQTPDYTIAGACSLLNKKYDIPRYSLIAGSPAKFIKTGIYRCLDAEESEIKANISKSNEGK